MRKPDGFTGRLSWRHVQELFWLCAGQAVTLGLGVFTIKLLTSMGPSDYGTYSLVLTVGALTTAVLYAPFEQGFVRFYFDYANRGLAGRFVRLFRCCLLSAGAFCLASGALVILAEVSSGHHDSPMFILSATAFVILFSTTNPLSLMLNVLRKRRENALCQIVDRLLSVLFLIAIFEFMPKTVGTALPALSLAMTLGIGAKVFALSASLPHNELSGHSAGEKGGDSRKMLSVVSRFGAPYAVWGLAAWLQSGSERWVILSYLSAKDVGIFALMTTLATYAVALPQGVISQFVTPLVYERFAASNDSVRYSEGFVYLRYLVLSSVVLAVISVLGAVMLGKSLIVLLSSEDYAAYWYLLPVLCLGIGLLHIGHALTLLGASLNLPRYYLVPKIASGFLAITLSIVLVKLFGMGGAALSIATTGGTYLLLIQRANVRIRKVAHGQEVLKK